jgi:dienelactone hydrolase
MRETERTQCRRRGGLGPCGLALLVFIAACSDGNDAEVATVAALLAPGPHAVRKTTLTLVDGERATPPSGSFPGSASRTLPTDVYAPAVGTPGEVSADAELAAADGPYPLLVFAHGFGGNRTNFTATLAHLASRGFVVAAMDFPSTNLTALSTGTANVVDLIEQPRDVSFVIDSLLGSGDPAAAAFASAVDAERIGALGHSFGGGTVLLSVFGGPLADERIDAVAAVAPFTCVLGAGAFSGRHPPVLVIHGTDDAIANAAWTDETYEFISPPKLLLRIVGADHLGYFSDPVLQGLRDSAVLPVLAGAADTSQFEALGEALLATVPGADPDRCSSRPIFPDPAELTDPLLPVERQREVTDVFSTAFFEALLHGDGAARGFLTGPAAAELAGDVELVSDF